MECPVCYENEACCKFTCGHNFCHSCTKSWFQKGQSTCPMCRASMCFRGIVKLKKKWYREKQDEVYKHLVARIFDELAHEYADILLKCLEILQNRFEYIMGKYPDVSCDTLLWILPAIWTDIDYLMNELPKRVYEPSLFGKYLMVSRYKYGTSWVY